MKNNYARHFLGFFMGTAFFLYLGHTFFFLKEFDIFYYYDAAYLTCSLLVYPMYYHYIRLLTVDTHFRKSYLLHYLPALLIGLVTIAIRLFQTELSDIDKGAFFEKFNRVSINKSDVVFLNSIIYMAHRIVFSLQVIFYFVGGYVLIKNHRESMVNFYSNHEKRGMRWVRYVLISLAVMSLLSIVFNIVGKYSFLQGQGSLIIPSLLFSTMLFILGYLANVQDQVVREIANSDRHELETVPNTPVNSDFVAKKMSDLFENKKIYLKPDLKIWDLSTQLGTNRTYLSKFINNQYGVNFSVFVNRFRVSEAKKILASEDGKKFSLEVIAEKCGFGSYNNFIRVFGEMENVTPGRYRDRLHENKY